MTSLAFILLMITKCTLPNCNLCSTLSSSTHTFYTQSKLATIVHSIRCLSNSVRLYIPLLTDRPQAYLSTFMRFYIPFLTNRSMADLCIVPLASTTWTILWKQMHRMSEDGKTSVSLIWDVYTYMFTIPGIHVCVHSNIWLGLTYVKYHCCS